jgi:hypothetical protein
LSSCPGCWRNSKDAPLSEMHHLGRAALGRVSVELRCHRVERNRGSNGSRKPRIMFERNREARIWNRAKILAERCRCRCRCRPDDRPLNPDCDGKSKSEEVKKRGNLVNSIGNLKISKCHCDPTALSQGRLVDWSNAEPLRQSNSFIHGNRQIKPKVTQRTGTTVRRHESICQSQNLSDFRKSNQFNSIRLRFHSSSRSRSRSHLGR